jgi:hypothetical protein
MNNPLEACRQQRQRAREGRTAQTACELPVERSFIEARQADTFLSITSRLRREHLEHGHGGPRSV